MSAFFDLPIPDVDELDGSVHVTGSWDETKLDDIQATLREGSISGELGGKIGDLPDLSGMDLTLEIQGGDLRDIESLLDFEGLPQTTKVSGKLGLSGRLHDMSVRADGLTMERGPLRLAANGWLLDLGDVPRVDMKIEGSGNNIRDIVFFKDVTMPPTDRFEVRGRLRGSLDAPDLDDLVAQASLGAIRLKLEGRLPDVTNPQRFQLRGEVEGDDLSRLGDVYGQKWPQTTSFKLHTVRQRNLGQTASRRGLRDAGHTRHGHKHQRTDRRSAASAGCLSGHQGLVSFSATAAALGWPRLGAARCGQDQLLAERRAQSISNWTWSNSTAGAKPAARAVSTSRFDDGEVSRLSGDPGGQRSGPDTMA